MVIGCPASDAAFYPTVVIDANGGTVDITGTHGQGVLLIRNGDAHLRGTFKFGGVVIVEGTLRVTGTPQLEGAVVAMGEEAIIDPGDDSTMLGNSLIRFNKCQIVEAQRNPSFGDCPAILNATFSQRGKPSDRGDAQDRNAWDRGWEDGQRLAWSLELLRRLPDCFLAVPPPP